MILDSIRYHRKRYMILVFIITLSLILLIFNEFTFLRIKDSISEFYEDRYGTFHIVLFSPSESEISYIESQDMDVAQFTTDGPYTIEGIRQLVTLGSFSEESINMGHLTLLEGHWPEYKNEIAVEKYTLDYVFPSGTKVGSRLKLTDVSGNAQEFVVSGVISNYSSVWNLPSGNLIQGYNDYPTCITVNSEGKINMMIRFREDMDLWMSPVNHFISSLELSSDRYAENYFLYEDIYRDAFSEYDTFKRIILMVIFMSTVISSFITINIILEDRKATLLKYLYLGTANSYIFRKINLEFILVTLPVFCILSIIAVFHARYVIFIMTAIIAVIFLAVNFLLFIKLKHLKSEKRTSRSHVYRRSLSFFIYRIFSAGNVKKVIPAIFTLSMIFTAIIAFFFVSTDMTHEYDVFGSDLYINNTGKNGFSMIRGIELHGDTENIYSLDKVYDLFDYDDSLENISIHYFSNGNMIMDKNSSYYWTQLLQIDPYEGDTDHIQYVPGMPSNFFSIGELQVQIIPERFENDFLASYPGLPLQKMKDENSIALILPPLHFDGKEINNDILRPGDMLHFARFDHESTPDVTALSSEDLSYHEFQFPICYIFDGYTSDNSFLQFTGPCLLIPESVNSYYDFIHGITDVELYFKEGISDERYYEIRDSLLDVSRSIHNSRFHSKRESREDHQKIMNMIQSLLYVLLGTFGLSSVLSVLMIIYMNFLSRKRSIGIFRSLGLKKTMITRATMTELFLYCLATVLLTFVFTIPIIDRMYLIENILTQKYYSHLRECFRYVFIGSVLFLSIVPVSFPWIVTERLYRIGLSDSLRYSE